MTTMLSLRLFTIRSPTLFYLEAISDIQCQICARKKIIYYIRKYKKILPTTMLSSLVNHNSSITAIYTDAISDIKCQLYHLH